MRLWLFLTFTDSQQSGPFSLGERVELGLSQFLFTMNSNMSIEYVFSSESL